MIDKGNKKLVNRYEYLHAWRNIAAAEDWYVEDQPTELSELKAILRLRERLKLAELFLKENS